MEHTGYVLQHTVLEGRRLKTEACNSNSRNIRDGRALQNIIIGKSVASALEAVAVASMTVAKTSKVSAVCAAAAAVAQSFQRRVSSTWLFCFFFFCLFVAWLLYINKTGD